MKILFLTSRFPFPPVGGDKLRVFKLIESLSQEHSVTLFALSDEKIRDSELMSYSNYCSHIKTVYLPKYRSYLQCLIGLLGNQPLQVYYYRSREMEQLLKRKIPEFDLVFVHLIRMAEYVKSYKNIRKVLDLTDAISLNYQRSILYQRGLKYLISRIEKARVLKYETDIINYFDKNLFVSDVDKKYIERYTDVKNVNIVPVGVDTSFFSYSNTGFEQNEIVFIGNMRTYPNNDAAYYFADEIFPLIIQKCPEANFTIVGTNPTKRIMSLNERKHIFVTGHVDDVRPYLRNAAVTVCPMRAGAGMQNKILESMAVGTPVVSSIIGLEGIGAVPDRDILVAENELEFAEKVAILLKNKQLRNKISRNGRMFVEERFSDNIVVDKLRCLVNELCNN